MKRWHLTIKDNEKNEVVVDLDTTVILGSYSVDNGVNRLQATSDNAEVIGQALYGIEKLSHDVKELSTSVLLAYMMYKFADKNGITEEKVEC